MIPSICPFTVESLFFKSPVNSFWQHILRFMGLAKVKGAGGGQQRFMRIFIRTSLVRKYIECKNFEKKGQ
jgi:hypothetical protein